MRKIIMILSLFLFMNTFNAYTNLTVYDMDGDRVLYGFNNKEKVLIASITKIMTSLVALENSELNNELIINDKDIDTYGSSIYLKNGDKVTTRDLVYGLLLRSGNDAALTLCNHIFGCDEFVRKMNLKAYYLGLYDTYFYNPSGLDDKVSNYSTTDDLTKLITYALSNDDFKRINKTKKYNEWYNKNELLSYYKYTTAGKTGYTGKAGYTFVSSASKDNKNIAIASINDSDRFNTHKSLYELYFNKYKKYELLNKYTFNIKGKSNEYLYIKNSYSMLLNDEEKDKTNIKINLYDKEDNHKSGYVSILIDNKEVHRETIYSLNYNDRIKSITSLFK